MAASTARGLPKTISANDEMRNTSYQPAHCVQNINSSCIFLIALLGIDLFVWKINAQM